MKLLISLLGAAGIPLLLLGVVSLISQPAKSSSQVGPEHFRASLPVNIGLGAVAQSLSATELLHSMTASVKREELGELLKDGDIKAAVDGEVVCPSRVDFPSSFLIEVYLAVRVEGTELSKVALPPDRLEALRMAAGGVINGVKAKVGETQLSGKLLELLPAFELALAGATIRPERAIKVGRDGRAWWSVSPEKPQLYKGYVRPASVSKEREFSTDSWWPSSTDLQFEFTAKPPPEPILKQTWAIASAILGSLLTIPGMVAFYVNILEARKK